MEKFHREKEGDYSCEVEQTAGIAVDRQQTYRQTPEKYWEKSWTLLLRILIKKFPNLQPNCGDRLRNGRSPKGSI